MNQTKKFHYLADYFYPEIIFQANKVMFHYHNIPIQKDDLINVALFKLPDFVNQFNSKFNVNIKAFIAIKSYYYMMNYARKFTNKSSQILNHYVSLDLIENYVKYDQLSFDYCKETFQEEKNLNVKKEALSSLEKFVYKYFFSKNLSMKKVAKELNVQIKTVSNAIYRIRKKFGVYY